MKTRKFLVLVMALLAMTMSAILVQSCSNTEKPVQPAAPALDERSGLTDATTAVKGQLESTSLGVGAYNAFPSQWKFPFVGSSTITVGYNGNSCGLGFDKYHTGNERYAIDWSRASGNGDMGDPLLAPASGWAAPFFGNSGYGNYIRVDAGNGYSYLIAHMQSIALNYCGWVERGQYLGALGCSGTCAGAHIHFVVYKNGVSIAQTGISGQSDLRICSTYSANW